MTGFRVEARYQREHGENPAVLTTLEDVNALIDWLLAAPADHRMAQLHSMQRQRLPSGWPDHELLVGVDPALNVGALEFYDHRGNLVTVGPPDSRVEVGYCIMGHLTEFPPHCEVPLDLIRAAVKEFCSSGGMLPTCVTWEAPEIW
jgi:hypothetical protein